MPNPSNFELAESQREWLEHHCFGYYAMRELTEELGEIGCGDD